MNKKDLEYFRSKLLAEKNQLEEDLSHISKKDPNVPGNWDATPGDIEVDSADENEVADKFEELEENMAISNELEMQLNEVNAALDRVEKEKYGICETCGKPIERERLEANPSSRVSIKHSH